MPIYAYMLENREILKRTFPELFKKLETKSVQLHPYLRDTLESLTDVEKPNIVVLTPGIYNSAYFEHSYLAQQMVS
jgi:uncharacterized circularly permuted ATP-grasp superfamily protein